MSMSLNIKGICNKDHMVDSQISDLKHFLSKAIDCLDDDNLIGFESELERANLTHKVLKTYLNAKELL